MAPLTITAECRTCGREFAHAKGQLDHTCTVCGGHIACGYPDCDRVQTDTEKALYIALATDDEILDAGRRDRQGGNDDDAGNA